MNENAKVQRSISFYIHNASEFNLLCDEIMRMKPAPLLQVVPVIIQLDPEGLEVYLAPKPDGEEPRFRLTKRGVLRFAHAAGIVFDPRDTHRCGDLTDVRRVVFQVSGSLLSPDGRWMTITKSKELDLDAIEQTIRLRLRNDLANGKLKVMRDGVERILEPSSPETSEYINLMVAREMTRWQRDKVAYAETGAQKRVICALLAIRDCYTASQLAKPFVVPRVRLNVRKAMKDPDLKRELLHSQLEQYFAPTWSRSGSAEQSGASLDTREADTAKGI